MRSRSLLALLLIVVTGCGGATQPTRSPLPSYYAHITPRPTPTPTPEPSPWSSGWPADQHARDEVKIQLFHACFDGAPVPGASPYAGKVHPLVVFDMNNGWLADVDINQEFPSITWPWPSPIQLLVCANHENPKKAGSCGLYETEDGEVGEVLRYQDTITFRVIVAQTGKTLQTKVLTNPAPKCLKDYFITENFDWMVIDEVTDEQINKYATTVSKQAVK